MANHNLTAAILCREALVLAYNLPWQMKPATPFHAQSELRVECGALGAGLRWFSENYLLPAVIAAIDHPSESWPQMMEQTTGDGLMCARQSYGGVTCRVMIAGDWHNEKTLCLDLEFSSASTAMPPYHWLGAQAEVV